jgi:hypothetical protein
MLKTIDCLMEKPKLKKSKTLSINIHEIELKAFSIYMRRGIPGISCSSVKCKMSFIRRCIFIIPLETFYDEITLQYSNQTTQNRK